jgi:hypothetical protein
MGAVDHLAVRVVERQRPAAPHARPFRPCHRLALHRADDAAAVGDQRLPADLDDPPLVHQLRANRPNAEVLGVGIDNYASILTDPDIWGRCSDSALLFWTITATDADRLCLAT